MTEQKTRENRLRGTAKRQGLELRRNPRRDPRAVDYGSYVLANPVTGTIVADFGWEVPGWRKPGNSHLDDVEDYLTSTQGTPAELPEHDSGDGPQSATSDEVQRNFGRFLADAQRGVHTDILHEVRVVIGEEELDEDTDLVATLVPIEWHEQVVRLLMDLRRAEAGWDTIERLREVAALAGELLPPAADSEHLAEYEDELQAYVRGATEAAGIVPLPPSDPDQGK